MGAARRARWVPPSRVCTGCRKKLDNKKRVILAAMIIHLNDDHRWDGERIAAWVAGNGDKDTAREAGAAL